MSALYLQVLDAGRSGFAIKLEKVESQRPSLVGFPNKLST